MWSLIIVSMSVLFVAVVTWLSYFLGKTKADNAMTAGTIGFFLSFLPPLALIYLVILSLKEDTGTV